MKSAETDFRLEDARDRRSSSLAAPHGSASLRVAFADPPYENESKQHYGWHKDYGGEVPYDKLVDRMLEEYPDGWALCMKVSTLPKVMLQLEAAGKKHRVGAWCKTNPCYKKNVNPAYAWEPVVFVGGRRRPNDREFIRDYCVSATNLNSQRFVGAKPEPFCLWAFAMLGLERTDEVDDLFPGTGAIGAVWKAFKNQEALL